MKKLKKYKEFVNESSEKWKEILKPKPLDKVLSDPNYSQQSKFRFACRENNLPLLKELLKDDRVDPSDGGNASIIWVSHHGYLEVVKELLKDKRVDPSDSNNAPILYASGNGHLEVVKELLKDERVRNSLSKEDLEKYKNQVNQLNENQKWKEILKPKPYDKVIQDLEESNLTPQQKFQFACENGILPLVRELLKDGRIDPSTKNNYAIRKASYNNHFEIVKELLKDERVDPSDYNNYAIMWASSRGHLEVVKELLKDERVDPTVVDNWSIRGASNNGHLEVVRELMKDERVDSSDWNNIAIKWASENGHVEVVKELLKDERVRKSLDKIDLEEYENQISDLNEKLQQKNRWEKVNPIKYSDELIRLVKNAYKKSTLGSFINTKKDLIESDWLAIDIDEFPDIEATIFYRKSRPNENFLNFKIQGIGHDGNLKSISVVLNKLEKLLNSGDYWVKASGAVENILYKMDIQYIDNEKIAQKLFPNTKLKFIGDKGKYKRIIGDKLLKETIFGNPILKNLNESSEKWKEILKPKSLDKILQDLEKLNLSPQEKFDFACKNGVLPLVKELLKDDRVDPSDNDNYTVRYASQYGRVEVVKELLKDDRVDPSTNNQNSIRIASLYGHVEVVKELLKDDRVDPSDRDNESIRWSSENGHVEVVKELLKDDRVDPSTNNQNPIKTASLYGHVEVVKELLKDERVDPPNDAIKNASQYGHLEVVKELLKDERVRNKLSNNDLEKYENQVKTLNESSSFDLLFEKPEKLEFLDINFDIKIDPDHFMKWLKLECDDEDFYDDYPTDCSSMCEYGCLYLSMLFHEKPIKGEMKVYYGNFGFWEHYWIGYTYQGKEYFIDLTLQQFDKDAPKLSITESHNERKSGKYSYLSDGIPINEYIEQKQAFKYYTDPNTMIKPNLPKLDFFTKDSFDNLTKNWDE